MSRCSSLIAAAAVVFGLAASCGGGTAPNASPAVPPPAPGTPSTPPPEAPVSQPGVPGTYVPTSMAPVQRQELPPTLQHVDSLAGGDPTEAACIRRGIAASTAPGEDRPEARAGVAGTTVVECVPPAKLAAALTDRLKDPALGLELSPGQLACIHANLASSAASPDYTMFVGGAALGDRGSVGRGAAVIDAACGTALRLAH